MRLPNRRPCMSVNAVTTVSIAPDSASAFNSSRDSMPLVPPGPPGRSALIAHPPLTVSSDRRSIRRDLVLLERSHRPLVLVLRGYQVPDPEYERQQDRERRVVHEAHVEAFIPRQAQGRVRKIQRVNDRDHEDDREDVDDLVALAEVPHPGLELVALSQPQVDGDDVGDVEADGADPREGEERE